MLGEILFNHRHSQLNALPSLTSPSIVTSTLPALRSLWMTRCLCKWSSPFTISWVTNLIWSSVSGFSRSTMMLSRAPPPQNSINIWNGKQKQSYTEIQRWIHRLDRPYQNCTSCWYQTRLRTSKSPKPHFPTSALISGRNKLWGKRWQHTITWKKKSHFKNLPSTF